MVAAVGWLAAALIVQNLCYQYEFGNTIKKTNLIHIRLNGLYGYA